MGSVCAKLWELLQVLMLIPVKWVFCGSDLHVPSPCALPYRPESTLLDSPNVSDCPDAGRETCSCGNCGEPFEASHGEAWMVTGEERERTFINSLLCAVGGEYDISKNAILVIFPHSCLLIQQYQNIDAFSLLRSIWHTNHQSKYLDQGKFLVDGFPRSFENMEGWERVLGGSTAGAGAATWDSWMISLIWEIVAEWVEGSVFLCWKSYCESQFLRNTGIPLDFLPFLKVGHI